MQLKKITFTYLLLTRLALYLSLNQPVQLNNAILLFNVSFSVFTGCFFIVYQKQKQKNLLAFSQVQKIDLRMINKIKFLLLVFPYF